MMYNRININMREKDISLISEAYISMYEPNEPAQFKIGDNVKVNEEKLIKAVRHKNDVYEMLNRGAGVITDIEKGRQGTIADDYHAASVKFGNSIVLVPVEYLEPIQTEAYKDINRSSSDIYNMQDNRQDFRDWLEDYGIEPDEEGIYNIDDFRGFGYSNENRVKALFDKDQVNLLFVPEKGLGGKPARNTFNRFDTENIIDWIENYISIN